MLYLVLPKVSWLASPASYLPSNGRRRLRASCAHASSTSPPSISMCRKRSSDFSIKVESKWATSGRSMLEHPSTVPPAYRSTMSSNSLFGSGCGVAHSLEVCPTKASITNSNLDFSSVCGGKSS
ncbi:unnamed protein product [Linum trigynum]|uniref:Uncharacterized protein n=1 Tax=Linum trigynum TaxID=586398 RepID=A0AAV2CJD6_9ROSI